MRVLLLPLGLGILFALILAALWRRLSRALRATAWVAVAVLLVSMMPLGANVLVRQIESRVPDSAACEAADRNTIVVLSGGLAREPASDVDFPALHTESLTRAVAGIEFWRARPGSTLVFAGGGPFAISESDLLQKFAERMGVPAASMRREGTSQSTWDNARALRDLRPALPERIWLVSSALHLPRALIAFRAAGFDACPYASEHRYLPPEGIGYFLPQSSALIKTEAALHELAGEVLYRWRSAAGSR